MDEQKAYKGTGGGGKGGAGLQPIADGLETARDMRCIWLSNSSRCQTDPKYSMRNQNPEEAEHRKRLHLGQASDMPQITLCFAR